MMACLKRSWFVPHSAVFVTVAGVIALSPTVARAQGYEEFFAPDKGPKPKPRDAPPTAESPAGARPDKRAGESPPEAPRRQRREDATPEREIELTVTTNKEDARLQARTSTGWQDVCRPPCTFQADSSLRYRVSGDGIVDSAEVMLPLGRRTTLAIDASSQAKYTGGAVLTVLGAVSAAVGSVVAIKGNSGHQKKTQSTGTTVLGLGVVGLAVGFPIMLGSWSSSVKFSDAEERGFRWTPGLQLSAHGAGFGLNGSFY